MLWIYNSLPRKKEQFTPIKPPNAMPAGRQVGMYTCGPTVYDYASIGNFRTYVTSDILRRTLMFNGYKVKSVMNITDVGHLVGDGDLGQDKIAQTAEREKKTAWDIAKFYTEAFLQDMKKMGILEPDVMPKATEHIKEQIILVQKLEEKGFTYKTSDGVYFDTEKFKTETGTEYGKLSTLDQIKAGARVEANPEKKNPRDFALWKFSEEPGKRHMEWESPWGLGFPGWHIECSAMSMKYLGESFDIHVGGEDLRQTHHPNEIAQSEGATGKPFVKYWVHTTFLLVEGKRMGKSEGNVYTVSDVEKKGFSPLALRYLYLTAHYRDPLNFTWDSLQAAQKAYEKLSAQRIAHSAQEERKSLSSEKQDKIDQYRERFLKAVNDDLNTPQALAVLWEVVKSNIPAVDKRDLLLSFDEVLGLGLGRVPRVARVSRVPRAVRELVEEREKLREEDRWEEADRVRVRVREMGYKIEDTEKGPRIKKAK